MKQEILALFRDATRTNNDLVSSYGTTTNEGPKNFVELKIGLLSLIEISKIHTGWRIVFVRFSSQTASSITQGHVDCADADLIKDIKTQLDRSFSDLRSHHEVWRNLGIV